MAQSKNEQLMARAEKLMPAGVNSPVRAFGAVGGHPPFIERGAGSKIYDADGKEYVDYVGSWGPAILGHAHPEVIAAVTAAAQKGLSFGVPTELEVRFAELLTQRIPSMQMLRCVSSGTEATMSALRAARGFTGREVIVKFDGAYHGHADALLVKAGSGAATFGQPDSAGVPEGMVKTTLTLPYNDVAALDAMFAGEGSRIAAVIVEPVAGNMGCVPPAPGFLQRIVELCEQHGAVAIFDEVMTGCRLAAGGAQERFGITPHMTCLGKVVGGGMPLAVYGGRADIMQKIAPLGPVYQAGTLSGNPVAVTAGMTTLELLDARVYERLEQLGAHLEQGLHEALSERDVTGVVQRVGSMITLFFHDGPVHNYAEAGASDKQRFARWHHGLRERGVYWPASQFEAAFISAAHTDQDIERTLAAARDALT